MLSVLQPWVMELPLMQQAVLLTAMRGPDGIRKDHTVKVLMRWYRRGVLLSAFHARAFLDPYEDDGGSFTGPLRRPDHIERYVGDYLRHVDELPHHFQLHFMHGAEILGYKHPDDYVREFWYAFYQSIVADAHLSPEPVEKMDKRLSDNRTNWIAAEQVIARDPNDD